MGNLVSKEWVSDNLPRSRYPKGRAGYGATTEGMWPYTYDACDVGTFVNQTNKNGTPTITATGAPGDGPLSYLPGQRLSACTCPGSDHPGPNVQTGRGVPEIDIFETQVDVSVFEGQVSQSFQIAPYDYQYEFVNTTPAVTIQDTSITQFNTYKGGVYQQAVSTVTYLSAENYNGLGYAPYAFEWWSDPSNRNDGYVTWYSNGQPTWTATAASVGPNSITQISQRLIAEEPMVNPNIESSHTAQNVCPTVHCDEFGFVPRLPEARFQAFAVPITDVHRLRTGIPARGCAGWTHLQSSFASNNRLH
jgi:hypothetical protein